MALAAISMGLSPHPPFLHNPPPFAQFPRRGSLAPKSPQHQRRQRRGFLELRTPPPPCNPPPPMGGDHHLAQKAQEIPGAEGAEENFSLGYTGTGVGGDRHLVTAPPPPPWGDQPDIRGGGDSKGAGIERSVWGPITWSPEVCTIIG